ncbi:hypothetical protein CR983_01350 [Candidatus Saccharibacteria bacterium]|nr:MAG: hypothetical protein CR983_01350 [Candidatus Saccharibacteria bacterium]
MQNEVLAHQIRAEEAEKAVDEIAERLVDGDFSVDRADGEADYHSTQMDYAERRERGLRRRLFYRRVGGAVLEALGISFYK